MAHDQCESLKIKVNKPPLLHREGSERYGEECKGWERELSGRGSRKLSFRRHFQRSKLIHGQFCPLPFGSFCHFCEGRCLCSRQPRHVRWFRYWASCVLLCTYSPFLITLPLWRSLSLSLSSVPYIVQYMWSTCFMCSYFLCETLRRRLAIFWHTHFMIYCCATIFHFWYWLEQTFEAFTLELSFTFVMTVFCRGISSDILVLIICGYVLLPHDSSFAFKGSALGLLQLCNLLFIFLTICSSSWLEALLSVQRTT